MQDKVSDGNNVRYWSKEWDKEHRDMLVQEIHVMEEDKVSTTQVFTIWGKTRWSGHTYEARCIQDYSPLRKAHKVWFPILYTMSYLESQVMHRVWSLLWVILTYNILFLFKTVCRCVFAASSQDLNSWTLSHGKKLKSWLTFLSILFNLLIRHWH